MKIQRMLLAIIVCCGCYMLLDQSGLPIFREISKQLTPGRPRPLYDFYQYWAPANDFRSGYSIYSDLNESTLRHENKLGQVVSKKPILPINAYPPFATIIFLPLSFLPYSTAFDVWVIVSVMLLSFSIYIVINELWIEKSILWKLIVGFLSIFGALTSAAIKHDIVSGNISCLMLFLITMTWMAYRNNRLWLSAFFLGIAFSIKLFPGLIFVFLFFKNRKAFCYAIICSVILFLLTLAMFGQAEVDNFADYLPRSRQYYGASHNHSVFGFFYRLFGANNYLRTGDNDYNSSAVRTAFESEALAKIATIASVALAVAVLISFLLKSNRIDQTYDSRDRMLYEVDLPFASISIGMVLLSPIAWVGALLILILPIAIILFASGGKKIQLLVLISLIIVLWLNSAATWEHRLRIPESEYMPWESLTHLAAKTYAMVALLVMPIWQFRQWSLGNKINLGKC